MVTFCTNCMVFFAYDIICTLVKISISLVNNQLYNKTNESKYIT